MERVSSRASRLFWFDDRWVLSTSKSSRHFLCRVKQMLETTARDAWAAATGARGLPPLSTSSRKNGELGAALSDSTCDGLCLSREGKSIRVYSEPVPNE
jgi:hypothetical protein